MAQTNKHEPDTYYLVTFGQGIANELQDELLKQVSKAIERHCKEDVVTDIKVTIYPAGKVIDGQRVSAGDVYKIVYSYDSRKAMIMFGKDSRSLWVSQRFNIL